MDWLSEASTGFGPVVRVLQTLALPLGHDASSNCGLPIDYLQSAIRNSFERAMGFGPTTFSLARRRSTTELRPHMATRPAKSAESQDRTDDTAIFSRVLYQLSYLGLEMFARSSGCDFTRGEGECQARGKKHFTAFLHARHIAVTGGSYNESRKEIQPCPKQTHRSRSCSSSQ